MDLGTILLIIVAVGLLIALVVFAVRSPQTSRATGGGCGTGGVCFLDNLLGCGAAAKKETIAPGEAAVKGLAQKSAEVAAPTLYSEDVAPIAPQSLELPIVPSTMPAAVPTAMPTTMPTTMVAAMAAESAPMEPLHEERAGGPPTLPFGIPVLRVQHNDPLLSTLFVSDAPLLPTNVSKEEFERLVDEYDKRYLTMPKMVIPRTMHFNYDKYVEQQERMDRDMVRHHQQFISRDEVGSLTEKMAREQASRMPIAGRSFQPRSKSRR